MFVCLCFEWLEDLGGFTSLLLSLVRAIFLLQQLPLVGVRLVQLRIAAATKIRVCTPK